MYSVRFRGQPHVQTMMHCNANCDYTSFNHKSVISCRPYVCDFTTFKTDVFCLFLIDGSIVRPGLLFGMAV